ncbi:BtpA/SgcQ family protein [Fusobacterium ulcerans]|uniref:BtpA/SgcQ family protein n=1 Tax=Fusobacterium ulcerans TaxID=861 RepID=UPI0026EC2385|nr:BtpA/SgcQ family protein [Fusobacterium ulcerans]
MNWIKEMFKVKKPIIALLHLRALPGDPLFSEESSMEKVIEQARFELISLQEGGVDGILIANEFSLPYEKNVSYVTVAAMGRIIGELKKDILIPFGVNIVSNPLATIDLAAATGADFVRSTFTGAYVGENGITDTNIPETLRRKKALGLNKLKLFYKVNPESDIYLAERSIEKTTKSLIFHCFPDGLCVSGNSAGVETDSSLITRVKSVANNTPVFCNTGCTKENIIEKLSYSDGACVGTAFKKEGKFENFIEKKRVREFMEVVFEYRKTL